MEDTIKTKLMKIAFICVICISLITGLILLIQSFSS